MLSKKQKKEGRDYMDENDKKMLQTRDINTREQERKTHPNGPNTERRISRDFSAGGLRGQIGL